MNINNLYLEKLFNNSKYKSYKYQKYFQVYEYLFSKYINKKITFVEIGVLNGGSLFLWREFFGNSARIIGIDLNPDCKKLEKEGFEIFIGDQSDKNFWFNFFNKVGKVDIVLDDGGHTNIQQIQTTCCVVENINDNGVLVIEDTHTSYMKRFFNPSKYSFINFAKKIIDDINYMFLGLGSFNFSLNKYIHSIEFFESIVAFKINKNLCIYNRQIQNTGLSFNHEDFRNSSEENKNFYKKLLMYKKKYSYKFLSIFSLFYKLYKNHRQIKNIKKYFK
jgi:hypothetical protein